MSFDPAELNEIHARLLARDPTASADFIGLLYGPLIGHAIKKHRNFGMDRDRAADFSVKVLAELVENPESFDPARGNLFGFLCMAMDGDVINACRDMKKRREIFSEYSVEVREVGGNSYEPSPESRIDAKRMLEASLKEIVLENGDKEVLELVLAGEREYDQYAKALGIEHLPRVERRSEVKRRKDRIEKRLERFGKKL